MKNQKIEIKPVQLKKEAIGILNDISIFYKEKENIVSEDREKALLEFYKNPYESKVSISLVEENLYQLYFCGYTLLIEDGFTKEKSENPNLEGTTFKEIYEKVKPVLTGYSVIKENGVFRIVKGKKENCEGHFRTRKLAKDYKNFLVFQHKFS